MVIGLIEATISQGPFQWPEDVKHNFEQKVISLHENLEAEMAEFIEFGSTLDRGTDDDQ